MINELIIPRPDDMHLHLREGDMLKVVSQRFCKPVWESYYYAELKKPSYKY